MSEKTIFIDMQITKTFTKQSDCSKAMLPILKQGLGYIDNSNINVLVTLIALEYSVQDGLHLNKVGRKCLENDVINSLNAYILCNKKSCKIIRDLVQAICTANKESINLKSVENGSSLNGLYQSLLRNIYNFTTRNVIINSFSAKFD